MPPVEQPVAAPATFPAETSGSHAAFGNELPGTFPKEASGSQAATGSVLPAPLTTTRVVDDEVEARVDEIAYSRFPFLCLALGGMFGAMTLMDLLVLPAAGRVSAAVIDAVSCAVLLGLAATARHHPPRRVHALVGVIVVLGAVNVGLGIRYFPAPVAGIQLIALVLGAAVVSYRRSVLAVACALAMGIWLAHIPVAPGSWRVYGVLLLAACAAGIVIQGSKVSNTRRIERLSILDARRQAELENALAATRASEARFRGVFDHVLDVITLLDDKGRVLHESPSVKTTLGWNPDERIGASAFDRVHPDDLERAHEFITQAVGNPGRAQFIELRYRHANDTWRNLDIVGANMLHEPGLESIVCISRDVTERNEQREALSRAERLSSLGTLVAGVAHEINNPLMFMQGNVELTQMAIDDALHEDDPVAARRHLEEAKRNQDVVLRGIDRISRITSGLRRTARSTDGRRELESVATLCDETLALVDGRLHEGLLVERDYEARQEVLVNASEMSQALLALVTNAIDAMDEHGSGILGVRTRDEGDQVVFEITDTGGGILPQDAQRLFTPFHTTKPAGTGLGLSIGYRIVQEHGGEMTFETRQGKGTVFRVRLPAAAAAAGDGASAVSRASSQ